MKKLNLKTLKSVEKGFISSPISHNALKTMVDVVLHDQVQYDTLGLKYEMNYEIALNSLVELGILVDEDPVKKPELLKS